MFSNLDIILVIIPALSFAETLGAILLALNVFEKTINLESCACSLIISATDFPSLFEIFGYDSTDEIHIFQVF